LSEIVLCCGKVCSGKSTFVKILEEQFQYYTFSADDWMLKLYDETEDRVVFDKNLLRCTELIYSVSEKILKNNSTNNIALDFGFWKKTNRNEIRDRFSKLGYSVSLVYFPIEFEQQITNMNKRQKTQRIVHYHFNRETVYTLNMYFEEPDNTEQYISKEDYLQLLNRKSIS